jgi:membrane-associated phospholipid phosphatase
VRRGRSSTLLKSRLLLLVTLTLVPICSIHAQALPDTSDRGVGALILSDGANVLHDAGQVFGAPLHFSGTAWAVTGAVLVGTTAFIAVDESARSLAQRLHSDFGDDIFGFGREYGREVYGLTLSVGLYGVGLIFDAANVRETGVMLFESIAIAGTITTVLKSLIGRSRPYTEEGAYKFRGFQFKTETTSLPSGHTTVAFAVSSVLAGRINNPFASIGFYSVAALTAVSRVYHDAHWVSDNVLAAAIGTCVGLAVNSLHDTKDTSISIQLVTEGLGVRAEVIF